MRGAGAGASLRGIMSNVVLLFSGQGAQTVGMGQDLAQAFPEIQEFFAQADQVLGRSLTEVMFEGPDEELTRTGNCQPALYLHGLALWKLVKARKPELEVVAAAGLSLGEWTAHAAAGTFDEMDGLQLVEKRGELMEEACDANPGAMAAMIGGKVEDVERLAADCGVDVANLNCPGQIVLSGSVEGIDEAVSKAKEYGLRMGKKLPVAGAYHSSLMASAQEGLAPVLADQALSEPAFPVVSNVTAKEVTDPTEVKERLIEQITSSVRWEESVRLLLEQGHTTFLELGPGKVLKGFMGRIDKTVTVHCIEDQASLEAFLAE